MEIEHIGDNKIRCALTEQEIESLGYDIDEIIVWRSLLAQTKRCH